MSFLFSSHKMIVDSLEGMVLMNETLVVDYRMIGHYSVDFHSHQEYEIYIFHKGSCRYLIHNNIYDLEPGDIIVMNGMTLHKPNVDPNSEYIRSVVHFSPHWIKSVLIEMNSMYLLEPFQKLHHCLIRSSDKKQLKKLEDLLIQLAEVKRTVNSYDKYEITELKVVLLHVLIVVHRLCQVSSMKLMNKKGDKAEHAENIAEYVQSNYMKKLTLQAIANDLNLSKSYVAHVFKEMTGFTVMEYVMGCRLTQVKYLLEMETGKKLKDIAYETGFESVSHFSRYFREKVGVTAKNYRSHRTKNKVESH